MMKRIFISLCMLMLCAVSFAQNTNDSIGPRVLIQTSMGDVKVQLYNDTPLHRDNFLRLVKNHFYEGILFHRVIKNFMVQCGDPNSKKAEKGQRLGSGDGAANVPAEIRWPQHFHKRGALAAAREGDEVNPERKSSGSQFYIVWGQPLSDYQLDHYQSRIDQYTNGQIKLTEEQRAVYRTLGGTPHLDGSYTVFGEVIEGLDVIDKIQSVETDESNRPLEDIKILSVEIKK